MSFLLMSWHIFMNVLYIVVIVVKKNVLNGHGL